MRQFDRVVEHLATRVSTWSRNQSTPRSSTRYLSRALLRSSRLPKSRWVVTIASTTSTRSSGVHPHQWRAETGIGVVAGDAATEAATDEYDEPGQLARGAFGEGGHDADVVAVDVDAVVTRPGHADLELARQVDVAVDGLGVVGAGAGRRGRRGGVGVDRLGAGRFGTVDPQLPVGGGPRAGTGRRARRARAGGR